MRTRRPAVASAQPSSANVLENATREFRGAQTLFGDGDYAAAAAAFGRVVDMTEHEPNLGPDLHKVAGEFAAISRERAAQEAARVFTEFDADVVPPVISSGKLPARPPSGTPPQRLDVLELLIDASGNVEKARLETSRNHYDNRWWVSAAKTWRFQPASRNGRPVRFMTRIPIADGGPR
jgi:hypothetical protein